MRTLIRRTAIGTMLTCVSLALPYGPLALAGSEDDAWADFVDARGPGLRAGAEDGGRVIPHPAGFGGSLNTPPDARGGGDGQDSSCVWIPQGPLDQVAAAQAAVNAGQMPDVADPTYTEDIIQTPAGQPGRPIESDWYRVTGTTAQVKHALWCNGGALGVDFLDLVPDGAGGLVVQIRAQDLVPGARDEVIRRLPTPLPRIGPADESRHGWTYVNIRTFFWVDQTPGQWHPVSATASAGNVSVTVTAEPVRLRVDPGDGSTPVVCDGAPPAITKAVHHDGIHGCAHTYRDSSAMAPNGQTWPVSVSIVWHATWTATTGEGGDLGYVATTSTTRDLPVAEIQAVITHTDN